MSKFSKIGFLIAVVLMIGLLALSNSNSNSSTSPKSEVKHQESLPAEQITTFSSDTAVTVIETVYELKKRLQEKRTDEVLLDVRTPEEFRAGHIPGAVNLDVENPNFSLELQKLDKNKTYIVFCRSGNRAWLAAQEMLQQQFKVVYSKEGISAWVRAGFELSQS